MKHKKHLPWDAIKQQAAQALLKSVHEFLRKSGIELGSVSNQFKSDRQDRRSLRQYREAMRTYEDMGVLMATWYSHPKFLDKTGDPLPLPASGGPTSIVDLIKHSGTNLSRRTALELMRKSPSIKVGEDARFVPLRRVFVLPDFELPRAALIVQRYLETLLKNSKGRRLGSSLLLERSCYAPEIDIAGLGRLLRDIKEGGTAFMDATDSEIEACRSIKNKHFASGEVGAVVFAWTKTNRRRSASRSRMVRSGSSTY